jgi:hypothetical protein
MGNRFDWYLHVFKCLDKPERFWDWASKFVVLEITDNDYRKQLVDAHG